MGSSRRSGLALSLLTLVTALASGTTLAAIRPDFNGDGRSDIAWHNRATGQTLINLMDGTSVLASSVILADGNWRVVHTGDFNGDGMADLLWRNASTGQTAIWLMNGTVTLSAAVILNSAAWTVTHVGDFNGDARSDLLWRNLVSGETAVWLMNGTVAASSSLTFTNGSWLVTHLADLNGDGRADLVWRNDSTGQTSLWLMNGTSTFGSAIVLTSHQWSVTKTADLNGDGRADLVWRNKASGQHLGWLMNGLAPLSTGVMSSDPDLALSHTGDFDFDGRDDLVWRNSSTGHTIIWLMNGLTPTPTGTSTVGNHPDGYVRTVGNYNADNRADLIWTRVSDGHDEIRLMNGLASTATALINNDSNWVVIGFDSGNVIGYHDGTHLSATWGWACDTTNARARLPIYLYSFVGGVFTSIGSTSGAPAATANRLRQDVETSHVCSGAGNGDGLHGFVFTAYPQALMDGQAHDVYAYAQRQDGALQLLASSPQIVSFVATGLWDSGLLDGKWRTDYYSQSYGATSALILDADSSGTCWWLHNAGNPPVPVVPGGASPNQTDCLTSPRSYSQSNSASSDGVFGSPSFWVVTANSEPAYAAPYNPGPPNQTDPVTAPGPGQGLYSVIALPDAEGGNPSRKKMHMIINKNLDPYSGSQRGPFLSFGAQSDWGNGHGSISLLRTAAAKTLSFAATLFDINPNASSPYVNLGYVIVEAQWGGNKRWAFISLLQRNLPLNAHYHFNWNILGGLWFPGADIVFREASSLNAQCIGRVPGWIPLPQMSTTTTYVAYGNAARHAYTMDLEKLFSCLSSEFSTALPATGPVPITGIHFGIEQGFQPDNYTWIAIDSVLLQ